MTAQMVDCIGLLAQQECPRCRQGFCTETDERCRLIEHRTNAASKPEASTAPILLTA